MNITTNQSDIKLKDIKDDLNDVEIIKEIKVNGLVNGSARDIGSLKINIIDQKKRPQPIIDNADKKSQVQITMNDRESLIKNTEKTKKDSIAHDCIEAVPSCYDSNENIMQLDKSQSSNCIDGMELSVGESTSCPEALSVAKNELFEVKNLNENYKTDLSIATDTLLTEFENLNLSTDQSCTNKIESEESLVKYVQYENELQMPLIMKIIQKDLSEPYSIYTYRYFIHNWPKLCFSAMDNDKCVGAIVCKLDVHRKVMKRGYIAMLAVDKDYRKKGIGSTLVKKAIQEMILGDADEVVLETEVTNQPALQLYEALGFVRDKRLFRYYLNGVDALRLKLWLR